MRAAHWTHWCIDATATRRWLNGNVDVWKERGAQEEFPRPLQATLRAPGMVVVCRNAAMLSHHRAPSSQRAPFASLHIFFFFLIRDLVSRGNRTKGTQRSTMRPIIHKDRGGDLKQRETKINGIRGDGYWRIRNLVWRIETLLRGTVFLSLPS